MIGKYDIEYIKEGNVDKKLYDYYSDATSSIKKQEGFKVTINEKINPIIGGLELLPMVKPLWEGLIEHHSNISKDFSESIRRRRFEERVAEFGGKANNYTFRIELIEVEDTISPIGYCISSISSDLVGEVESIFIEEAYRGLHIGDMLMKSALNWMDGHNVKTKKISVMAGNDVLKFYEKYGFKVRSYILEQVD